LNSLKYYGAPGTGKTWTLTQRFRDAVTAGTPPENILFTQFRREAAIDTKYIISTSTGIDYKKLSGVRTIHSGCLSLVLSSGVLGSSPDFLMKIPDYADFNAVHGYRINPTCVNSEGHTSPEDPLLSFYDWMKATRTHINDAIDYPGRGTIAVSDYVQFYKDYVEFKQSIGKIDFSDMLDITLDEHMVPDCPVQIYDEAQDMTPVMYDIAEMWGEEADQVYFAGDPLQTLYTYRGADPDLFMNGPGGMEVLPVSRRLPANIWKMAGELIKLRTPYNPPEIETKKENGIIQTIDARNLYGFMEHDFFPNLSPESTVFHLVRTNYLGATVARALADMGIPFTGINGWKPAEIDFFNAVMDFRTRATLGKAELKLLLKLYPANLFSYKGTKAGKVKTDDLLKWVSSPNFRTQLSTGSGIITPALEEILRSPDPTHGMENANWWFSRKMTGALTRGIPRITSDAVNRVQVLTIHGAKGLEANNVFLHASIPPSVKNATLTRRGIENEAYVFYVGLTRTTKNLFVVSYTGNNYPIPGACE